MPRQTSTESSEFIDAVKPSFLRIHLVVRMTGLGRSTIYRMMAEHRFPAAVRLGVRAIGWRREDLDRWSAARQSIIH